MRTINDLTPDERNAYKVWRSKLSDRTLSAGQHDECRREIDNLLWKGPNSQVLALKAELAAIAARLERLEFHAGLADDVTPEPISVKEAPRTETVTSSPGGLKHTVDFKVEPPPVDEPEPSGKKETRGRKKLRFHPEKNATGGWMVLDRDADEYTSHGPYKTRKESKAMADTLNNMPNQPPVADPVSYPPHPLEPRKVYHDGDGVIRDVEPQVTNSVEAGGKIGPDPEDPLGDIGF